MVARQHTHFFKSTFHQRYITNYHPTFRGGHIPYIIDNRGKTMNSKNIRKLTPSETLRLMDMDEDNIKKIVGAKDGKGRQLVSDTRIYAAAGNGIVTACLEGIFHNLFIK